MIPLQPPYIREDSPQADQLRELIRYLHRLTRELNMTLQMLEEQLRNVKDKG